MMRCWFGLLVLLLVLPAGAQLAVSLSADPPVLFSTQRTLRRATEDTPRFDITTTKLQVTFTNTGTAPVKLNTWDMRIDNLKLEVTGPTPASVERQIILYDRMAHPLTAADIVTLKPGESWTLPIDFPGDLGCERFSLREPGAYRLRVTYTSIQPAGAKAEPLLAGIWQGAVASDELTLKVLPAGPIVNGLQMALDVMPRVDNNPKEPALTAWFRNAGDKPFTIPAWDVREGALRVFSADGTELAMSGGGADRSRELTPAERFTTLAPGATFGLPLVTRYYTPVPPGPTPVGTFATTDRTGFFREWKVSGEQVLVQAHLAGETAENESGIFWHGEVTSPRTVLPLDMTTFRLATLKADLKTFAVILSYSNSGDQSKPFYSLRLQTAPLPPQEEINPFLLQVQLTDDEADALIDYLAKLGVLREADGVQARDASRVQPIGYYLTITGGPQYRAHYTLDLGWDLAMLHRLDAAQKTGWLPEKAKAALATLLGRLAGLRKQWEAAAAPAKRLTLTFNKLPLDRAVQQVNQAVANPDFVTSLPLVDGEYPSVTLQFTAIPAQTVLTDLGTATGWVYYPEKHQLAPASVR